MVFEVYADILFLNCFSGNLLILICSCILMKKRIKKLRFIIFSALGALYSTVIFYIPLPFYLSSILNILFLLIIIFIIFQPKSFRQYIKSSVFFLIASSILGGCTYLIYNLTSFSSFISLSNGITYFNLPPIYCLAICAVAVLLLMTYAHINNETLKKNLIYTVDISVKGNTFTLEGLYDTGNLLRDFLTGLPVFIAQANIFENLFQKEVYLKIISGNIDTLTSEQLKGLRILPVSSAFSTGDLIVCLKPDKIIIHRENKSYETDALIGLVSKKLSLTDEYNMLLA
ncbi:MAG: hypothetical protein E7480_03800 [Ruminococcaceae bacterium]|nr:hypothetical protein [Oscillospiraceae bacterium]